jgi:glycine betaine monooxygenase B
MSNAAPKAPPARRPSSRARIERIFDHNRDTRSLFLRPAGAERVQFVPGQFISVAIELADETRTRAYSIASDPGDDAFEICFNRVAGGRGVAWLFERAVGDFLTFTGPYGTFTMAHPPAVETAFVAEGTALAPIRPMLRCAARAGSHAPTFLLYAAADREHVLYRRDLEELAARDGNFRFELIVPAGANDADLYGRLYDEVERRWVRADEDRTRQFYVCGVGKGVIRIRDLLRGAGYERRAVHYEQW